MQKYFFLFLLFTLYILVISKKNSVGFITYTSVIKLEHVSSKIRLHSHEVNYRSGSGQQSVTGNVNKDDVNSHWQILPAIGETYKCGKPIAHGAIIRLKHLLTGCFLHSHDFQAPISKSHQEVSCFGGKGKENKNKDVEEESDSGDYYKVIVSNDYWTDEDKIKLKHNDTNKYLLVSGEKFGRPIDGQYEIVASSLANYETLWKASEGIYFMPSVV